MPRMVAKNLTDSMVRAAQVTTSRYELFDAKTRGLGLRVGTGGTKTFFVMRRVNGQMQRRTLGAYPSLSVADARKAAGRELSLMAHGEVAKQNNVRIFRDLYEDWIARDQAENRTVQQVRNAMELHVLPKFGKHKASDISKSDIIRLIDTIADAGKHTQANRILAYIKRLFSWAAKRDLLETNPAINVEMVGKEISRARVLSPVELGSIIEAARALPYPFGPFTRILLLSAQRRDEVAAMRWSEVDMATQTWTVPGTRMKNGEAHHVHLSDQAMDILGALPHNEDTDLVFPATRSRAEGDRRSISGFSKAKLRLDERSSVSGWRYHDFRRSFASHATERLGVSPAVADKILAHKTGVVRGVAAIYNRAAYLEERRKALQAWANWLDELGAENQKPKKSA
jgi:integrase